MKRILTLIAALLLGAAGVWAQLPTESVSYIDADGSTQTANAVSLSHYNAGSTIGVANNTTWYYVTGSVDWGNNQLTCTGDLRLILSDGATFTINNLNGAGIKCSNGSLTVYGQTNQTGQIVATGTTEGMDCDGVNVTINGGNFTLSSSEYGFSCGTLVINRGTVSATGTYGGISVGNATINSGTVTATSSGDYAYASKGAAVTFNGGSFSAIGTGAGQYRTEARNTSTIGYSNNTDRFTVSNYQTTSGYLTFGSFHIATGQYYASDDGRILCGELYHEQLNAIAGHTLSPHTLTSDWSGTGDDAEHPYIIANAYQLNLLALRVNGKVSNHSGKYFKLGGDITYTHTDNWNNASSTENNYTSIGIYDNGAISFNGHFDGDGHTISGIRLYNAGDEATRDNQGLFGRPGNGAVVENVTLADARVTAHNCVGGIVGYNDGGTVMGCTVGSNVAVHAANVTSSTFH